jgi:hypothetical protein
MRFRDFNECSSPAVSQRRWRKYCEYLQSVGFRRRDSLYRFFAGNVFHDGQLTVSRVAPATCEVVLTLENVYSMDEVCRISGPGWRALRINRQDFRTSVHFRGVHLFQMTCPHKAAAVYYDRAEIGRTADHLTLEIATRDRAWRRGIIKLAFAGVRIENIAGRIRSYAQGRPIHKLLTPIDADPGTYATQDERSARTA